MYINSDIDYLKYLQNKEVVIFGAGEKGKRGFSQLSKAENIEITAFCDNDQKKQGELFCGLKVISFADLCEINHSSLIIVISSNYEAEIKQQLSDKNIHNFISVSQIDFGGGEYYYDAQYFSYQQKLGEFGGEIAANIFLPHIKESMTVIEFGSGGGYLLDCIHAKEKLGIEINDTARLEAKKIGINSVKNIEDVPDDFADIIISTHALEHVENPLGVLRQLRNKLKQGGKIVFHVPNESCDTEYSKSDINNHLYTWNCLTLGNLFKAGGYFVHSVQKVQEMWPKHFLTLKKEVSFELFEVLCELGGKAYEENRCIIVAYK